MAGPVSDSPMLARKGLSKALAPRLHLRQPMQGNAAANRLVLSVGTSLPELAGLNGRLT